MKYSSKPRHFAPHKTERPFSNKNLPHRTSNGGKLVFQGGFMDVLKSMFSGLSFASKQQKRKEEDKRAALIQAA